MEFQHLRAILFLHVVVSLLIFRVTRVSGDGLSTFNLIVNISHSAQDPWIITQGEWGVIHANITCMNCQEKSEEFVELFPQIKSTDIAQIYNFSLPRLEPTLDWSTRGIIFINGLALGKTELSLVVSSSSGEEISLRVVEVHVLRRESPLDTAFTVCVAVLVAINTVAFACGLDLKVVVEHLKKPTAIGIGFVCQYVFMPLIAFGMARAFSLPDNLAFGLLCYGSSPGGGFSNIYTILLRGDLDLSVSMTLTSTIASLAMTSLWLFTLGRVVARDISIPYQNIAISLVGLVATCVVGLLIAKYLPKVARVLKKIVRPFAGLIIVFILSVGIYANRYIFQLMASWRIAVSSFLVSWTGYLLSFVFALLLKRPWKIVRTIVIETGVQNGGLAILILRYSLPQPDADLATVAPVMALMTSSLPLLVALAITMIIRRMRRRKKDKLGTSNDALQNGTANQVTGQSRDKGHTNISFVSGSASSFGSITSYFRELSADGRVAYESGV